MVYFVLVQLIVSLAFGQSLKADKLTREALLGERSLSGYAERYYPLVEVDPYRGKSTFRDDEFWQFFLNRYGFEREEEFTRYLKLELSSALTCTNEQLSKHFEDIRYAYRLISLSYLMEGQWHLDMVSRHLGLRNGCKFSPADWPGKCQPKTTEMKKFVERVKKFAPKYRETLPTTYDKKLWLKEFKSGSFTLYSHYRLADSCQGECTDKRLEKALRDSCQVDEDLMTLICSENDEAYGLSTNRDAYQLLSSSNIINTFNKEGEATGCLRRFAEVLGRKEVRYPVLDIIFPPIKAHLTNLYQERFQQGRVFFYGSGKEFEEKGLSNLYVLEQPLKIESLPKEKDEPVVAKAPQVEKPKPVIAEPKPAPVKVVKKEIVEVKHNKSAFLQAAESRSQQNIDIVEVDMLKLRYDYVFTLNQINRLSAELATFMTREALIEMATYDKLGAKEGPVPLLFIKYMIDMQEHTGLYNIISILGDSFWVSNEIDANYQRQPEYIRLVNDASTSNQWQIFVLKPR